MINDCSTLLLCHIGKLLFELIEPCETRLERVRKFLMDVGPHLKHRIVQIDDPFGPTVTDKEIGLIVVSAETIKGAEKINEIRKGKDFPVLDVHHIILFSDTLKHSEHEEDKISSSSQRMRILGNRLRPPVSSCGFRRHSMHTLSSMCGNAI
jgi:phosphopantetheine adenylyltransferase/dephospho-CoA kinase